jgi:hypothetical protein
MPSLQFLRNMMAGNDGPIERFRKVAGNLARRDWRKRQGCCGHYGEPGC